MVEINPQQDYEPPASTTGDQLPNEAVTLGDITGQHEHDAAAKIAAKEILGEPNPSEDNIEYVGSLFTKHSKIAKVDDQVAACVSYIVDDTGMNAKLEILATDASFKRRGLARKLLYEAKAEMAEFGVCTVTVRSTEEGLPFYLSMDYEPLGDTASLEDGHLYLLKDLILPQDSPPTT